ncbi:MAG: sigma-70 family RNA polymerase sigma factor [Candidatus Latescibacteria bacterium]|nr:sigma-70 family RNA polymerase sigma factor [Candidatus Latescibacterota bacterium]
MPYAAEATTAWSASRMLSDEELLAESIEGDVAAFEVIVNRYKDRLFNFVVRFVGDESTAQDLVQDTFLRAYRKRESFKAIAKFSTWIYTIAGNLARSELRRRKRWRFLSIGARPEEEGGGGFELEDNTNRPDLHADTELVQQKINEAISNLPERYREAVLLRDVQQLDYEEISQILGVPLGTVKSRINRGRLRLQEMLAELADEVYETDYHNDMVE